MPVTVNIYPERLGKTFAAVLRKDKAKRDHELFDTMIRRGLRAQLRTGNFLTAEETDRVKLAFGDNYARLVQVKKAYDPENFFRLNQNIRPE